jgi:tripartite-type tricarboxylate transporter receptor subunit TctC
MRRLLLALALLAPLSARAQGPAAFFGGRTVNVVIGYSAGGGYDLYARLLARYLGRHIPGNPQVLPQNMPGAGSLKAANYLYYAAPKDGTVIGTFARGMPLDPILLGNAQYDGRKFTWLGSITRDTSLCLTWHTSNVKTWADLFTTPSNFGGEGAGSDPDVFANILARVFGAKVKLVTGYPGTADMTLAMQRGEIDGLCGISWSTMISRHQDWIQQHSFNILIQAALQKDPALPQVPMLLDETTDPRTRQLLTLLLAPQDMARPFAAPPGLPPDRAKALQDAFAATMTDPDFLAEAKKLDLDVMPVAPDDITKLLDAAYATPKDVLAEAVHATGG